MAKNEEKLNYAAVKRELKQSGPARLYLLHGEEDYLLESFIADLTRECLPEGADDFSLRELDGASLTMQQLADSVNALPFATERTLTIVRGLDLNHLREQDAKALEAIASDVPEYATLALVCRGAQEPDGRLKAVKALRRHARDLNFTEQGGDAACPLDSAPLRRAGQKRGQRRLRGAHLCGRLADERADTRD